MVWGEAILDYWRRSEIAGIADGVAGDVAGVAGGVAGGAGVASVAGGVVGVTQLINRRTSEADADWRPSSPRPTLLCRLYMCEVSWWLAASR